MLRVGSGIAAELDSRVVVEVRCCRNADVNKTEINQYIPGTGYSYNIIKRGGRTKHDRQCLSQGRNLNAVQFSSYGLSTGFEVRVGREER